MNRVAPAPKYEYKPSTFVEPRTINPFEPRAASHMNYDRPGYYRDNYEDMDPKSPSPMINQLSPNNPRGIQGLLFRESLALIEERIEVFRDINDRATYLENWVICFFAPSGLVQYQKHLLTRRLRTSAVSTRTKTDKRQPSTHLQS